MNPKSLTKEQKLERTIAGQQDQIKDLMVQCVKAALRIATLEDKIARYEALKETETVKSALIKD